MEEFDDVMKPEKCFFGKEEVEYFGFSITRDGIRATRSKIEAVLKVKPPETTKQLFSFLCSMNYYRMLIPRFGEISANLYQMCETKRRLCVWNDEMKNLFESKACGCSIDPCLHNMKDQG
jgi:hypothetical protein